MQGVRRNVRGRCGCCAIFSTGGDRGRGVKHQQPSCGMAVIELRCRAGTSPNYTGLIVNEQDTLLQTTCPSRSQDASKGKQMIKVVPRPSSVSKVILPLCFRTTTSYAIANPCPVPLPTSLVVKNGSKTLSRIATGMPVPVSA